MKTLGGLTIAIGMAILALAASLSAWGQGGNPPANTKESKQTSGHGLDGPLRTKADVLQDFKSGGIKYESIDERDVKINTYGDTAILNSIATVKLTSNGKPVNGDFRATFVYVKHGSKWEEVAFQSTPVMAQSR
jgi:hypothetical protein